MKKLLAALLLAGALLAQEVIIGDFGGMVSNADQEDLDIKNAVSIKNLKSDNGRLIKTFGMGGKISTATAASIRALTTLRDNNIAWDATAGRAYVVAAALPCSGKVMVYTWDGSAWDSLTVSKGHLLTDFPASYFDTAYVPVVKEASTLRLLPGGKATMTTHDCKGVWVGYIAREYFDGQFKPDTGWYGYNTPLAKPDMSTTGLNASTDTILTSGYFIDSPERYYKASYKYDDAQEGMLSSWLYVGGKDSMVTELRFTIDSTFNKRITALNIYKSDTLDGGSNGSYGLLTTVDFQRDAKPDSLPLAYWGIYATYAPSLKGYPFFDTVFTTVKYDTSGVGTINEIKLHGDYSTVFTENKYFTIVDGGTRKIAHSINNSSYADDTTTISVSTLADTVDSIYDGPYYLAFSDDSFIVTLPTSTFDTIFISSSGSNTNHQYWGSSWALHPTYWPTEVKTGTDGYSGLNMLVCRDTVFTGDAIGSNIVVVQDSIDGKKVRLLRGNHGNAIRYYGTTVGNATRKGPMWWHMLDVDNGYYEFEDSTTYFYLYVYDLGAAVGAAHPLAGEVSIDVNGKYARPIGGRLWQGDVVLDPYNTKKAYPDWLTYSEDGQYDVNPVSNAIKLGDNGGGGITGISETFNGYPVAYKRNSIFTVNTSNATPANLSILQSSHNIGNIAERGYINVRGDNYVIAQDKGIYRLRPNNLAESDQTPTSHLKISDPIQDVLDNFTVAQMEGAVCGYDQGNDEIIWAFKLDSTVNCTAMADNFIASATESTINYGNSTYVAVAYSVIPSVAHALLKFDLSIIPTSATVLTDTVFLYKSAASGVGPHSPAFYRLKRAWTETGSKWNVYTGTSAWGTAGADNTTSDREAADLCATTFTDDTGWKKFPLTLDSVRAMCKATPTFTNNGFYFNSSTDYSGGHAFYSRNYTGTTYDPYLKIGYTYYRYFAFNPTTERWREITSDVSALIFSNDENGNLLAYDSTAHKVYSTAEKESSTTTWQSKTFVLDRQDPGLVPMLYLTYKSTSDSLMAMLYAENSATAKDTVYFPPATVDTTVRRSFGGTGTWKSVRAKKFNVKIQSKHELNTDEIKLNKVELLTK